MAPRESRTKRDNLQPVVYRYEVRGDVPPEAVEELHRRHRLQNHLVEIEHSRDAGVAAIWAAHPDTGLLIKDLETAEERCTELAAELQKQKQRQRTARPDEQRVADLATARTEARSLRQAVKAAKAASRPYVRDELRAADALRDAAIKAAYGEAVADGLYWATVNDTTARHKTAVQRLIATRAEGRPAQMRFRRWDGTGTLAVQLQRQAGDPPRTPALLADATASKWRNAARMHPYPDEAERAEMAAYLAKQAELTVRIGSGPHKQSVTLPLIVHRPVPASADIAEIRLTRRRTGATYRVHVTLTCLLPAPPAKAEGALQAVHMGWRSLDDRSLRAAVITAPGPLPLPDGLEAVRHHGTWAEVIIPARLRSHLEKLEAIQARRDKHREEIHAWLRSWLETHPQHKEAADPDGTLHAWRSPGRFAALAIRLRDADDQALAEASARLEAWRKQDKHLWQAVSHGHDKIIRWRRDNYRQVAAWLASEAAVIAVDEWPAGVRLPDITEEDTTQAQRARANARLAAPGELRDLIRVAAGRRGVRVTAPDGVRRDVHGCGANLSADSRAKDVMVRCAGCGTMVDQDVNALRAMIAAASGQVVQ